MSRPVKFNLEHEVFYDRPNGTFRETVESFVYQPDIQSYLEDIYDDYSSLDIFPDLVDIKHDIEYTVGSRKRLGEAFLDGAILALDAVGTFSPDLLDDLHEELLLARFEKRLEFLSGAEVTDADERAYLASILTAGQDIVSDYAGDYGKVIFDTRIARGYKDKEHTIAMTHGFTYLMHHAGIVYQKDLAAFTREVREEIKPVELPHRIKVPLSLMDAIDKELQKQSDGWAS